MNGYYVTIFVIGILIIVNCLLFYITIVGTHSRCYLQRSYKDIQYNKTRALVCYVPNKGQYIAELKCLYQNFEELNLWKDTDLIIFHPKNFILSNKSKNRMKKMIMIRYDDVDEGTEWDGPYAAADCKPIKDLKGGGCKGGEKLRDKYGFVNSFKFFIDPKIQQMLSKYKYILKTDSDIFLTPRFKRTFPENKVMVGNGQYADDPRTQKRIKEVSKKLKYNHYNIFNVGATWYGTSEDIIKLGKLSYRITKHIYKNEFQKLSAKFKELKSLAIDYKEEKELNLQDILI